MKPAAAKTKAPQGGIPDFLQSPDKAIGVLMGDRIETVQIYPLLKSGEGTLFKGAAKGKSGWGVAATSEEKGGAGGGMMYFECFERPEDFRIWKGQNSVKMAVEFYDGTAGNLTFCYDAVEKVWKTLPPATTGLSMHGKGCWRTAVFDLPEPAFQRRCNGSDFRMDVAYSGPEKEPFLIRRITLFKVPEQW